MRGAVPVPRIAPDSQGSPLVTGLIWVLVVFMTVPEGFDYEPSDLGPPQTGSPLSRITWLALLGLGGLLIMRRRTLASAVLRQTNPYLLLFGMLAALSVLWSIDPAVTVRRLIRVLTIMLDALALTLIAWRTTRFQSVLRPVLTALLLGSIVFGLLSPQLAIEQATSAELVGAWRGLTAHKNALGSLAGTGTILWVHAWLSKETKWLVSGLGGAVSVACLLLSRSSTSLMACTFAIFLLCLMLLRLPPALRRYMPYLIAVFVIALLLYSLAMLRLVPGLEFLLKPITMITGKDQTFSNRTAIWAVMNDHIVKSPLLGTGYGAYWTGVITTAPSYEMVRRLYFYPSEGHNGYLDIINDLGAIGGLCSFAYLITYVRQGLRLFATVRTQGALYLARCFSN